jgi:acyl-CoA oxidase
MTHFLDGSASASAIRRGIMAELDDLAALEASNKPVELGDGTLLNSSGILPNEDHTLDQSRLQTMKMLRFQYDKLLNDHDASAAKRKHRMELLSLYDPAWFTRNGVHFGLFLGAIQGQGDRAQVAKWLPPTLSMTLFGCFAMTELGHGSFVRGIETTATYDIATQTFDIHTPALSSTKWWIGGAAKTATHAAVFAQLCLPDGSRPGVHTFIVNIRSLSDHSLMPGVRVGDCGAKFGRNGLDNGWIQFNHVKVAHSAMLCKYSTVDPATGGYTQRGRKQLQYGALIGGRAIMVTDSAVWLKAAVTIAVRYLCGRRQGDPLSSDGREPKLLEYRTVQTRVMPLVATAYALSFTALYMQQVAPASGLSDADDENGSSSLGLTEEERIAALPDLHATCAGLKAFSTWACYYGIDTLRQCLGGHGYSGYTALGRMFKDFAVQCTWEGDNTVMALQTSRYLVASYERLDRGETLVGSVSYLNSLPRINRAKRSWGVKSEKALRAGRLSMFLDAFRYLLAKKVERVALRLRAERHKKAGIGRGKRGKRFQSKVGKCLAAETDAATTTAVDESISERNVWNAMTPELLDCSRAHCNFVIAENFVKSVERAGASMNPEERKLVPALDLLARLFLLDTLQQWLDWFVATGYMDKRQMFLVKDGVLTLCEEVRKIALPAVDAFGLSDRILRSPLGRRDGRYYQDYFQRVLQKPGVESPPTYLDSHLRPFLTANL